MAETYSFEQIASNLRNNKFAIQGISEEVFKQNRKLFKRIGETATSMSEVVLSVQIFGSRVHGTSDLGSDIDMTVITLGGPDRQSIHDEFVRVADSFGIEVDFDRVTDMVHIKNDIPSNPMALLESIPKERNAYIGLFEEGIYHHPNLLLARLAVLETMYRGYYGISQHWEDIRTEHAETYLGEDVKIISKLARRLDGKVDPKAIEDIRSYKDLRIFKAVQKRHKKYGLPGSYSDSLDDVQEWFNANENSVKQFSGYKLYQEVLALNSQQ